VDLWEGERLESRPSGQKSGQAHVPVITSKAGLENTRDGLEAFAKAKEQSPRFKDYPVCHEFVEDPEEVLKVRLNVSSILLSLTDSCRGCPRRKAS
jgi:hypothetical protein